MVKLAILYRRPADETTFETHYNQNLALMEKLPGIQRRQACVVLGNPAGQSPFSRILELYFADYTALDQALVSPEGRAAGADLMRFARDAELIFAEVFEE
jgi:uncharacterized protein (TIGR02118 family)